MRVPRGLFVVALGSQALGCGKREQPRTEVVVAAAASLRGVLPEIVAAYESSRPSTHVVVSYGASGALRQEVVAGAPIDVVVFAGAAPIDDLVTRGLADASTRRVLATNSLVLIGPKGSPPFTFATLNRVPASDKIAIGDPRSVPAGTYAKEALRRLNEWDALEPRLVFGGDVSAVLAYARRGEVAAAVVYKTELEGVSDVDVLDELPAGVAPRAEVVVALVAGSHVRPAALDFIARLEDAGSRRALGVHGFGAP